MQLHQWLDLPQNRGRAAWLAEQLGCSKAAVSLWREVGVPLARIPRVADLTGGAVTQEAMLLHAMQCAVKRREREPA